MRQAARPANTGSPLQIAKVQDDDQSLNLDVKTVFSRSWGETVTDQNGTCYNVWGFSYFENKIYSPAYWGVFPLYFFGDTVGVTATVVNRSPTRKARLLLRTDCYGLNTDGSNGAELMIPREYSTTVAAGKTNIIDASFTVNYTPYADSGLDRLLIRVYRAPTSDDDGEHTVGGRININPNNRTDNEFVLTLSNGSTISRGSLRAYTGGAKSVQVKPKGNGNQNSLVVDGQPYDVVNANTFRISGEPMTVNLYNSHVSSATEPMGQWWMDVSAGNATITADVDGQDTTKVEDSEPILQKEAIFCPPEFEGDLWQTVSDSLTP